LTDAGQRFLADAALRSQSSVQPDANIGLGAAGNAISRWRVGPTGVFPATPSFTAEIRTVRPSMHHRSCGSTKAAASWAPSSVRHRRMTQTPEFELRIVESLKSYPVREERDGIAGTDLVTTSEEALEALKASKGALAILKAHPKFEDLPLWQFTAFFSVCNKSGTARYLDLWDTDHFDGFTDMQRCVTDCTAWFSGDGYGSWGSGQTKSGRVNCYFIAPTAGFYTCNARLRSFPTSAPAQVECLIDNTSFGPLSFSGTINQPHVSNLSAGGHHFRIRQRSGAFFFLSLSIWKLP